MMQNPIPGNETYGALMNRQDNESTLYSRIYWPKNCLARKGEITDGHRYTETGVLDIHGETRQHLQAKGKGERLTQLNLFSAPSICNTPVSHRTVEAAGYSMLE